MSEWSPNNRNIKSPFIVRTPTTFQSVLGHFFTYMKFIFEKSAGSEDFQQECLDALTKKYKDFDGFLYDFS